MPYPELRLRIPKLRRSRRAGSQSGPPKAVCVLILDVANVFGKHPFDEIEQVGRLACDSSHLARFRISRGRSCRNLPSVCGESATSSLSVLGRRMTELACAPLDSPAAPRRPRSPVPSPPATSDPFHGRPDDLRVPRFRRHAQRPHSFLWSPLCTLLPLFLIGEPFPPAADLGRPSQEGPCMSVTRVLKAEFRSNRQQPVESATMTGTDAQGRRLIRKAAPDGSDAVGPAVCGRLNARMK